MKYLTPEGLQKLKDELKERKINARQDIAKRLKEAKSLGDLSENTEYTIAKEIQALNEGRILELERIIESAEVIKPAKNRGEKKIDIGSAVEAESNGRRQVFIIVGSQEAQPNEGKISNESPLGLAFLGHRVGDLIDVETPKGRARYKIINIR